MNELDMIWEETLEKSTIQKSNERRHYRGQRFAHFTWNLYHPEDPIIKGDGMVIHHKDLNCLNDHISNLQKMTHGDHSRLHSSNPSEETRRKKSESHKGLKQSEETKRKRSESLKNPPEETRKKMSEARKGTHPSKETLKKQSESKKGEKNPMYGKTGSKNPAAKTVMVEYMIFSTLTHAAAVCSMERSTIRRRINANKSGYFYL